MGADSVHTASHAHNLIIMMDHPQCRASSDLPPLSMAQEVHRQARHHTTSTHACEHKTSTPVHDAQRQKPLLAMCSTQLFNGVLRPDRMDPEQSHPTNHQP